MIAERRSVDYEAIEWHVPASLEEPEAFARRALTRVPEGAAVFGGWKHVFTLVYVAEFQQGRHGLVVTRADHHALEEAVRRYAAIRPVYFVDPPERWLPPELFPRLASDPPLWSLGRR